MLMDHPTIIYYHYAEMLNNILNHPIKIKHLDAPSSSRDESSFSGEGGPLRTQGEGAYQSVTSTKERGSQGEGGTVMSHPFQEGVGGRDESPKEGWGERDEPPKKGWGDRDESSKRSVSQGGLQQS